MKQIGNFTLMVLIVLGMCLVVTTMSSAENPITSGLSISISPGGDDNLVGAGLAKQIGTITYYVWKPGTSLRKFTYDNSGTINLPYGSIIVFEVQGNVGGADAQKGMIYAGWDKSYEYCTDILVIPTGEWKTLTTKDGYWVKVDSMVEFGVLAPDGTVKGKYITLNVP